MMNEEPLKYTKRGYFRNLSLQYRLPLLIGLLLTLVIVGFTIVSYVQARNSAMEAGRERLNSLAEQLTNLFGQSAQSVITATRKAADDPVVLNQFKSPGTTDTAILALLKKLRSDSTWLLAELVDTAGRSLLGSGEMIRIDRRSVLSSFDLKGQQVKIGKFYKTGDTILYPILSPVIDKKETVGYLLRWRRQTARADALAMFSQLLGEGAVLYVGNTDGSLWSNLRVPVIPPQSHELSTTRQIPNTQWSLWIELSRRSIQQPAKKLLEWSILIGTALLLTGLVLSWMLSLTITRPIKKLREVTSGVSGGNYSMEANVERGDELGQLAVAFNAMLHQIKNNSEIQEKKIKERTLELEQNFEKTSQLNKELESFTYSVSHDLRAPLRIIDGYADMLVEDHGRKLDAEGQRVLGIIKANARRMGQLIDDLLNLSHTGRKELEKTLTDMTNLVHTVIAEQVPPGDREISITVNELIPARCDSNLIRQVWVNLLSNALKYSGKKEKTVISVHSERKGHEIIYTVKDNGVGFDMKYADKLFGVFQRLHKVSEFEGTGIGLALVSRIIARHEGRIWAESAPGAGASFHFALPE